MFLKRLFNFIPKDEFSKALNLFNSGNHRKALQKFEELRKVSIENEDVDRSTLDLYTCEARVALAKEHAQLGEFDEAVREMEAAVELKPKFADLHCILGKFYVEVGSYQQAQKSFRGSLAINNKFFKARVHLSRVLRLEGDNRGALDELSLTKHTCPGFYRETVDQLSHALCSSADEAEVNRLYHEILEERPNSAQISKELAIEAIQAGDNDEALRELKKAIALKPDYPDLHNYMGIAYGNNGMVDDAVEEFEIALKINPYYLKARLNLALLFYENGRFEEALTQLQQVIEVQPENQLANNLLDELRAVTDQK